MPALWARSRGADPADRSHLIQCRGVADALAAAGLAPDDATFVDVPAAGHHGQWAAQLAALRRADVDAGYVKGAPAAEAARRERAEVAVELDELADRRFPTHVADPDGAESVLVKSATASQT